MLEITVILGMLVLLGLSLALLVPGACTLPPAARRVTARLRTAAGRARRWERFERSFRAYAGGEVSAGDPPRPQQ